MSKVVVNFVISHSTASLITMNINDLGPKHLKLILSYLPLHDIIRLHFVCTHWRAVQTQILNQITSLTLLIGFDAEEQFSETVFSIPFFEALEQSSKQYAYLPNKELSNRNKLEFEWFDKKSAKTIGRLFRNIHQLDVSIRDIGVTMNLHEKSYDQREYVFDSICILLKSWPFLSYLQIITCFNFRKLNFSVERLFMPLFKTINECKALKRLSIDVPNPFYYNNPEKERPNIDLPIIATLEEFNINFQDFLYVICSNLEKYGLCNTNLKTVRLGSISDSDLTLPFFTSPHMSPLHKKFKSFPRYYIWEPHTDFDSSVAFIKNCNQIEKMSIGTHQVSDIYRILGQLLPLANLLYLEICFHLSMVQPSIWSCTHEDPDKLPVFPSVRILNINAVLYSHTDLHSIAFSRMFPNVEVLNYQMVFVVCNLCKSVDALETEEMQHKCVREGLKAWKKCRSLKKIRGGFSFDMIEWKLEDLIN